MDDLNSQTIEILELTAFVRKVAEVKETFKSLPVYLLKDKRKLKHLK